MAKNHLGPGRVTEEILLIHAHGQVDVIGVGHGLDGAGPVDQALGAGVAEIENLMGPVAGLSAAGPLEHEFRDGPEGVLAGLYLDEIGRAQGPKLGRPAQGVVRHEHKGHAGQLQMGHQGEAELAPGHDGVGPVEQIQDRMGAHLRARARLALQKKPQRHCRPPAGRWRSPRRRPSPGRP